ncbi:MAG: glycerate kinase, partial [Tissierellia bacterium]|nr:glycerate kinase [Tissierellia bacterium]
KYKTDYENISGVGAAGGLGYAFMSFLNGELSPGIDIIIDFLKLDEKMKKVDLAITGEGEINYQTMMGKAPSGVAEVAKKYDIPVIGIAGALGKDVELINDKGIDAFFSITPKPISLEKAMDREFAKENLKRTISQIMRVYRLNNKN